MRGGREQLSILNGLQRRQRQHALVAQGLQLALGQLQELPHPVAGSTHVFAPPYRLDGQRLPIRNAPPTLGEGTREVLQQLLQLSEPELQALRDKGVLTLPHI